MPTRTVNILTAATLSGITASTQAETVSVISATPASRAAIDEAQTLAIDGTWSIAPDTIMGCSSGVNYQYPCPALAGLCAKIPVSPNALSAAIDKGKTVDKFYTLIRGGIFGFEKS